MKVKYTVEKLTSFLSDLNNVLHTPVSIFDKDFGFLASNLGCGMTDYCKTVRDSGLEDRCLECDRRALDRCSVDKKGFSYLCHAGVWETVIPVTLEDVVIGYIIFGQYRLVGEKRDISSFAIRNNINKRRFKEHYLKLTEMSKEEVESVKNILKACIEGFYLKDAVYLDNSELLDRILRYIEENLAEDISVSSICKEFLLNKKQLYSIFRENLSITVKKYVLDKRMDKAMKLLKESELSVTQISADVGFLNYNNFIQRFKSVTGITPLKYRKKFGRKYL